MASPKFETRKATSIAYIEHFGPYDKVPWTEYIERLYAWSKEQKVMPGFYPFGIYTNNPQDTPPEKLRMEVGISFKGSAKESGGIRIRDLPEMKVATLSHKGPSSEFKNSYAKLSAWIEEKGYVLSNPPMEIYSKKPEMKDGVPILYAKILFPVRKK